MGQQISTLPNHKHRHELESRYEELLERAACAISRADVLVLLTGAGWSAESGLAVYCDIASVPAYKERGLSSRDVGDLKWLHEDPSLFYGIWGGFSNQYRDAAVHEGYALVEKWVSERLTDAPAGDELRDLLRRHADAPEGRRAFFNYTSNVDGHTRRCFGADEVFEMHGCVDAWQCADPACASAMREDGGESGDGGGDGRWVCPSEFRFAVDETSGVAPDGAPTAAAGAAAGTREPLDADAFASNRPKCVRCGGAARPAVLMWGDDDHLEDAAASRRWTTWVEALRELAEKRYDEDDPLLNVVLLEVGAGGEVTTVRQQSETLLRDLLDSDADACLIRINPELPLADDPRRQPRTLSLMAKGNDALRGIDGALQRGAAALYKSPVEELEYFLWALDPNQREARRLRREAKRLLADDKTALEAAKQIVKLAERLEEIPPRIKIAEARERAESLGAEPPAEGEDEEPPYSARGAPPPLALPPLSSPRAPGVPGVPALSLRLDTAAIDASAASGAAPLSARGQSSMASRIAAKRRERQAERTGLTPRGTPRSGEPPAEA